MSGRDEETETVIDDDLDVDVGEPMYLHATTSAILPLVAPSTNLLH